MRATLLALALMASPALAGSELQLDSNMPVVLYLDGESAGTVQPHEPLLIDIDSGVHNLRIQGVLGKDLYDRDLIFDDDTRTELVWQRKQLRLGQVVKLDPNRPPELTPESDELPIVPAHPQAPEDAEVEVADAPPPPPPAKQRKLAQKAHDAPPPPPRRKAVADTPAPPARPAPVTRRAPPAPKVMANTAPPVRDVRGPAPVPSGKAGSVVVEAKEGLDLQIAHGSQILHVTLENGELVVTDNHGTEIHFPSNGEAW